MEYRHFQIRATDAEGMKLFGYAARYNTRSLPMRNGAGAEFVEEIAYGRLIDRCKTLMCHSFGSMTLKCPWQAH